MNRFHFILRNINHQFKTCANHSRFLCQLAYCLLRGVGKNAYFGSACHRSHFLSFYYALGTLAMHMLPCAHSILVVIFENVKFKDLDICLYKFEYKKKPIYYLQYFPMLEQCKCNVTLGSWLVMVGSMSCSHVCQQAVSHVRCRY